MLAEHHSIVDKNLYDANLKLNGHHQNHLFPAYIHLYQGIKYFKSSLEKFRKMGSSKWCPKVFSSSICITMDIWMLRTNKFDNSDFPTLRKLLVCYGLLMQSAFSAIEHQETGAMHQSEYKLHKINAKYIRDNR